jgi:sterol 3beta-glucosyltransferase
VRIGIQTWGSDGDIRPFVALANGLARAGHRVTLAVTSIDGKDYSMLCTGDNPRTIRVAHRDWEETVILGTMRKLLKARDVFRQLRIVLAVFFRPLVDEMYAASRDLAQTNDLLIGHFICHPFKAAADKAGKPYVTETLNDLGVPSRFKPPLGLPNFGTWFNPFWWMLAARVVNVVFKKEINRLRLREGLAPAKDVLNDVFMSRRLNLLAISAVFCPPKPDWEGRHHICGSFEIEGEDEQWEVPASLRDFLRQGPPPAYMTIGSMLSVDPDPGEITRLLVDAALHARARAIVQSRWGEISNIPDHPDIYKIEKAPHHYIFPFCSLVVHHGGAGTTHSATRSGCPSIVVRHFLDQSYWGAELNRLRIAPRIIDRRDVTSDRLAASMRSVLQSPDMKVRAEELGRIMREEHGVRAAVDLIGQLK